MKSILQQLREQQQAAGSVAAPYRPENDEITPETAEQAVRRHVATTQQIQTPSRGLRGYTRILPPGKNSVAELTGDWIIEFWDKPSPWCSIEGEPVHPDFDGNLKAFEGAA